MDSKEKFDYLLADIRNLETLVNGLKQEEVLPALSLSRTCNLAYSVLEKLKAIENEQLQRLNIRLAEQQEELNHLSVLLEQYKAMAETCKKNIQSVKQNIEEAERPILTNQPAVESVSKTDDIPQPVLEVTKISQEPEQEKILIQEREDRLSANQPAHTVPSKSNISLHDILEKKNLSDFRKAFSLNDRFRFKRELFKGDENLMNQVISTLNEIHTLQDSLEYVKTQLRWDMNDETVQDFIKLLDKRFI